MSTSRRALITGSTHGIGLAIALELARGGDRPVLNYHQNAKRADEALARARALNEHATVIRADVTREDAVDALFERVLLGGSLDLLVNTVGAFAFKPFLDTTGSDWQTILDSSLLSAVYCTRRALLAMREQGGGQIINVGSMHAGQVRARPNTLPYAIAKAGIIHLTHTLAKTEAPHGIRVNAVCPGFIEGGEHTDSSDVRRVPLGRLGYAEDVAKAVAFLASDDASYITGVALDVHGGALL